MGAFHFEDVLLDYDVAMNYGNWVVVAEATRVQRPSAPSVICCLLLLWRLVMSLQLLVSSNYCGSESGEVDKQNRGAHGFTSLEDLAAWKREEFEWKLTAEKTLCRSELLIYCERT